MHKIFKVQLLWVAGSTNFTKSKRTQLIPSYLKHYPHFSRHSIYDYQPITTFHKLFSKMKAYLLFMCYVRTY